MFALGDALTGRARGYFNCIRLEVESFEEAMDNMRAKFERDEEELSDIALVELKIVQQREQETLDEYEDRVSLLVYRAFPRASDQERNRQSVSAFVQGLMDQNLKRELMKGYHREMQDVKAYIVRYSYAREACKTVSPWKGNSYGRRSDVRRVDNPQLEDHEEDMQARNVTFAPGTKGGDRSDLKDLQERVQQIEVSLSENLSYQRKFQSQLEKLEKLMTGSFRSPRGSPAKSPQKPGTPGYTGCRKCGDKDHFAKDCPKA